MPITAFTFNFSASHKIKLPTTVRWPIDGEFDQINASLLAVKNKAEEKTSSVNENEQLSTNLNDYKAVDPIKAVSNDLTSELDSKSAKSTVFVNLPVDPTRTPGFFTAADIIDPSTLKDKVRDKDYVLLTHRSSPNCLATIHKDGLRSKEDLALDPNVSADLKDSYIAALNRSWFSNDPSLIYFRPATQSHGYPINKDDIVIAVDPKSVFVFDQEHRARSGSTTQTHRNSGISIGQYHQLLETKPPYTFFSKDKTFIPWENYKKGMDYIPECCLKANKIDPKMFVHL